MQDKRQEFEELEEQPIEPESEVKKDAKNKLIVAYNYLQENYDFRYNEVTMETEFKRKTDKEYKFFDDIAYRDIDQDVTLNAVSIAERFFKNWVYGSRLCKSYDPFKDYINSLPKWDGKTDHIKDLLDQLELIDENKREYMIEVFKKWFIAYVAGLFVDEVANQTCFVLVGAQGKYKTTFLNSLVPKDLKLDYLYSSAFIAHNKDHEKYLATKMLINIDEMQAFNRSDIESIKSKITQDRVVLRLPYAKADIKAWRRASFVGSVNRDEFLNDATGSRRFLPFKISNIKFKPDFNIGLCYAQAFALYKKGHSFYFTGDEIQKLEEHNDPYKDKTMEEEYVLKHFAIPTDEEIKKGSLVEYLNTSEVMDKICKWHEKINGNNTVKRNIGVALQANGFVKHSKRRNGKPEKLWAVKINDANITEMDGSPLPGYHIEDFNL